MSFWKNGGSKNNFGLNNFSDKIVDQSTSSEFYELEPAIVLDIILDKDHPIFSNKNYIPPTIDSDHWPSNFSGGIPDRNDIDYTWIGRALLRPIESQREVEKQKLIWALPLDQNIVEYPLINEIVIYTLQLDKAFYSRKINLRNFPNSNADISSELLIGDNKQTNTELTDPNKSYSGPISQFSHKSLKGFKGVLGRYFWFNKNIRSIKKYEGDLTIESRFGQSIRLGSYDNKRENDVGYYKDYKGEGQNSYSGTLSGGGNPMIIIRNRQRPLVKDGEEKQIHEKLPPIKGTSEEKNSGGFIDEDINNDGSTISITSGLTISQWKTTCYKTMFEAGVEEQSKFSPRGSTTFKFPILSGDQVVINSDRLILSSRFGETFHFSKKRYSIVTDSEFTVDSHDQIVLNTNSKTVINSPAIYLGEYDQTGEPALLGQTAVNWLYELCNWLISHEHWYIHSHEDAGKESPSHTQMPVQLKRLYQLRDTLHNLLSRRVFLTGGGFAPGQNGNPIKDGASPVSIKIDTPTSSPNPSTSGVPGGFEGKNSRT